MVKFLFIQSFYTILVLYDTFQLHNFELEWDSTILS